MKLEPIFSKPKEYPKVWGGESWIINTDEYCGKFLKFQKGSKFSMHFHSLKAETFYILNGNLRFSWIDTETAKKDHKNLFAGDVVTIPRLLPHQLEAWEDSVVIEFSTKHRESDSYRVEPGDSQKQK